ncbi:MAG: hypothetical protein U0793_34325 [Gemmataceae bacterium]
MVPAAEGELPVPIGLNLCDQVAVDKDTSKPSLIGIFTGLAVLDFAEPQRFSAFAALTNGKGLGKLELVCNRLDTGAAIYRQTYQIDFPHPLAVVNLNIRIRSIIFPEPGWYDFELWLNEELIAQRRIRVYQATASH